MSATNYRVEKPEVLREKFYPDFLQKDMANFKAQGAILEIKPYTPDDQAVKFYQRVKDKEYTLIHQNIGIHRVKKGSKHKLVYTDNIQALDKYGNYVESLSRTFGTSRHPVLVPGTDKMGDPIMIPKGVRISHDIDFTPQEVDRIIAMCDPEYRDQINYTYSEIPLDSKYPFNIKGKYKIESLEIFKTAPAKVLKKMIERHKQNIESLSELEPAPVVIQQSQQRQSRENTASKS